MKIEKLNDHQIRCTLTLADLSAREIQFSELVCGTGKARSLFQDMMRQASYELGFETENMPLMIEATSSSAGSVVLVITRMDDSQLADMRLSMYEAFIKELDKHNADGKSEAPEWMMDMAQKLRNAVLGSVKAQAKPAPDTGRVSESIRLISFHSLDEVINVSRLLKGMYSGENTLYKDTQDELYILAFTQSGHSDMEFNRICNLMSEYGCPERATKSLLAYLEEHCETILAADAMQHLADL